MKILSSDYDGTFNDGDIDNLVINKYAVRLFMEQGNIFILNTGRPYESIIQEIERHDIEYSYLSCSDGLLLLDRQDNVVYRSILPESLYLELEYLNKEFSYYFRSNLTKFEYNNRILELMITLEKLNCRYMAKFTDILDRYYLDYERLDRQGTIYLFIREKNFSKATPIKRLAAINKVKDENIYSVGDTWNDIPMLKEYNGYSMEQGTDDLKDFPKISSVHELIKRMEK